MIDLKAIRAAAEAAPYEAPWRYEPIGQTVCAGNTYMVADIRGWGHLQYFPNGAALQDATGAFIATANPATILELLDLLEAAEAQLASYEKHGVTCQTFRHKLAGCAECNRDNAIRMAREVGVIVEHGIAPVFYSHAQLEQFAQLVRNEALEEQEGKS